MNKSFTMLTRYSRLGASSRHRFYNYLPWLEMLGYQVKISPFFNDEYLRRLYAGRRPGLSPILSAYVRRFTELYSADSRLLIEYEALPLFPWFVERAFLRRSRFVLNFDDNVWEKYAHNILLDEKFDLLTRTASGVIVANSFLEEKVSQLNPNVIQIPTALDPEPYRQCKGKFERFTIAWIGTPVTYKFLENQTAVWQELAKKIDFELLVIAREDLAARALPGVSMRFIDWSEGTEASLLGQAHVGVMPLTDDLFAQGKSAFKLLQYFAAGIPVVASPIGENRHVVENGRNGFLAATDEEWLTRLEQLYHKPELRETMAAAAAVDVEKYSLAAWVPRLVAFLERSWQ